MGASPVSANSIFGWIAVITGAWLTLKSQSVKAGENLSSIVGTNSRNIPVGGNVPHGGLTMTLDDIYNTMGARYSVDPMLLKAIASIESSERPGVKNPSDPSYGLFQILCRPDGNGGCANQFNVTGWPPESSDQLFDPEYNAQIGAQIIKWNIDTYGFNRGIAVYNNWSARKSPKLGPFPNQNYVNKVLSKYYEFSGGNGNGA